MNRTMLWLATLASLATSTTVSAASITGTVFQDVNADGAFTAGEGLQGLTVELYEDDGDGLFGSEDRRLNRTAVASTGRYTFANLARHKGYFVMPSEQGTPSGIAMATSVPRVIRPGIPQLLIDDFGTTQITSATPLATNDSSSMAGSNIIGGDREVVIELLSGTADAKLRVNPYGLDSVLQFDQSAGVLAEATITWDGQRTSTRDGLGSIDLTNGGFNTGFELRLGIDVAGANDTFSLRIFDASLAGYSEAVLPFPVTNGTAIVSTIVPFAAFVGDVSPSEVDAIQLLLGGHNPSVDLQLEYIGILGPHVNNIAVAIPEPASCFSISCGLVLLGLRRTALRHRR